MLRYVRNDHVPCIRTTSIVTMGAATALVSEGSEGLGTRLWDPEGRVPRGGWWIESELLGSQSGGGDGQDHTHPTAWQSRLQAEMGVQKYAN